MESDLLGNSSGLCEQCKEGKVTLVKHKDSYVWRCTLKKCRNRIAIRNGSFFSRLHLDFSTILYLIHGWICELPHSSEIYANDFENQDTACKGGPPPLARKVR